jgi:hypothetical protein
MRPPVFVSAFVSVSLSMSPSVVCRSAFVSESVSVWP